MNTLRRTLFLALPAVLLLALSACQGSLPGADSLGNAAAGTLAITAITDNRQNYPGGRIPTFEKLELTFQVENSVARNPQFPFDPHPPPGIDLADPAYQGISVDALLTPDDWQTVYRQPAFYQEFFEDRWAPDGRGGEREWFGPTGRFAWQVRFAPHQAGEWQVRLVARDAAGRAASPRLSFEVVDSDNPGFIRVSPDDPRYFVTDDGALFWPLGFQASAHLFDPVAGSADAFRRYQANGINLLRVWISGMFGSAWLEWIGGRNVYDGYLPRAGLLPFAPADGSRPVMTLRLDDEPEEDEGWFDACRFQAWDNPPAVRPDTTYRLEIAYYGRGITGPRRLEFAEFGLVGKIDWRWAADCHEPGTATVVTDYGQNADGLATLTGRWHSGDAHFLPRVYLALENVTAGEAYIVSVSVREELPDGGLGPEILAEPSMAYETYFPQQSAHALDKVVELAAAHEIALKLVIHDKGDAIFRKLADNGAFILDRPDNLDGFYGTGRTLNRTRWLQQAWWRYLQARWGYATTVHSWELTNEGNPWNPNHWALADELGRFMRCGAFADPDAAGAPVCAEAHPNAHLVTTSFWGGFPASEFWANPDFPHVDYADVHAYVSTGWLRDPALETDAALLHLAYSADARRQLDEAAAAGGIATRPIMRGETGLDFLDEQRENPDLVHDENGVWLLNLIWAGLAPGGLMELYWWDENLDHRAGPDGEAGLYEHFRYFREFLAGIPLANGRYVDAGAKAADPRLRVTGQKDTAAGRAHLWVQNRTHTWRNVVDGTAAPLGLPGTVTVAGFRPGEVFPLEWHVFTTEGVPRIVMGEARATAEGVLVLDLPAGEDVADAAVKIGG